MVAAIAESGGRSEQVLRSCGGSANQRTVEVGERVQIQ